MFPTSAKGRYQPLRDVEGTRRWALNYTAMFEDDFDPSNQPLSTARVEGGFLVFHGEFAATLTREALKESARRLMELAESGHL